MNKIIVGNWKMNGTPAMAKAWAQEFSVCLSTIHHPPSTIIICPPAPLITLLKTELADLPIDIGGQDCSEHKEGAYTGDTAADLLYSLGVKYVIVGHSERRQYHAETGEIIRAKATQAIKSGLTPIICVGETAQQRDSGETEAVLREQVAECHPVRAVSEAQDYRQFILAYEPVWAIGSGNVPTADDIKTAHETIISAVDKQTGLARKDISVLYGGSVKPENASEIMKIAGVAGVLVGGASLTAGEFWKIIRG